MSEYILYHCRGQHSFFRSIIINVVLLEFFARVAWYFISISLGMLLLQSGDPLVDMVFYGLTLLFWGSLRVWQAVGILRMILRCVMQK